MKEGDKLLKGGFFSRGDPEKAYRKWEQALVKFRGVIPATEESINLLLNALKKTGTLKSKLGYYTEAGNAFEEAARRLKEKNKDPEQACKLYEQAAENARLAGNHDVCGKYFLRAAEVSEISEKKVEIAKKSCDILIEEERIATSRDHFIRAVNVVMKEKAYQVALDMLLMQIDELSKLSSQGSSTLSQAQLSVIVIYLFLKNRSAAWEANIRFSQQTNFGSTEHSKFASKIIEAFNQCDEGLFESLRNDNGIYLVGEPQRLYRKMNFDGLSPRDPLATFDDEEEEIAAKLEEDGAPDLT